MCKKLLAMLLLGGSGFICPALSVAEKHDFDNSVYLMQEILVKDTADIRATGQSVISGTVLENLPAGNATLTDMLKVLPGVQFDEAYGSAATGGEILPPEVSISGGRFYDNYFSVDGTGNNSFLDPTQKSVNSLHEVPGHSMELSPSPDVLESLTVYDSNVPASYGGFTGGVVDARTRTPGTEFSGAFFYRTTRDSWTRFHLNDQEKHQMHHSANASWQPKFRKEHYGIRLDIPVTENMGFLVSFREDRSTIPLKNLGGTLDQTRTGQHFFVKGSAFVSDWDSLDISLTHAPYEGEYFHRDAVNNGYKIEGGGTAIRARHLREKGWGSLDTSLSWRYSENKRISQSSSWYRWAITPSKNWGMSTSAKSSSMEGGYGNLEREQDTLEANTALKLASFSFAGTAHSVETGLSLSRVKGREKRPEDAFIYTSPVTDNSNFRADPNDVSLVLGEQYFSRRQVLPAYEAEAEIQSLAFYLSDTMSWKRLTLRPGLRISRDDYLENTDLAPRFSADLDVLGTGDTVVTGGLNRYYGQAFLSHKLKEGRGRGSRNEWRTTYQNQVTPWEHAGGSETAWRFSDLDTPYSDEWTVGLDQRLMGGRLTLRYVERENKNEFARERGSYELDGLRYDTFSNKGRSDYRSVRVSWGRRWEEREILANLSWQESHTHAIDFNELLVEEDKNSRRVWYEDRLYYLDELPKGNYARPWVGNLTLIQKLPWNLSATAFLSWKSDFDEIRDSREVGELPESEKERDPVTGEVLRENAPIYEKVVRKAFWQMDLRLKGKLPFGSRFAATWDLEVMNLFDTEIRTSDNTPLMGRQFWAGISLEF
ncbi:outer membrane receptor protein involved in Fe transport [Desulfobotulus alkaliphilus]|uniref:Outer membrane receptor protein involved in Fe transport n=1 Tax=Desulfobotulus alkaliphilus TaxID=622671 RepID=A0A562RVU0_9BACT|nr:TonB-dependent receptor [Desulfobotulus alkaliphilus]TWI73229.1 outer membrane receptor protein involved in Fe transport [Desulfobotulus alkaliphilus]